MTHYKNEKFPEDVVKERDIIILVSKKMNFKLYQKQSLVLDVLEGVKAQSTTGTKRFGKLIGFKAISKKVQEVTEEAKAKEEDPLHQKDQEARGR